MTFLVAGIDGGQSSTIAVVGDEEGRILAAAKLLEEMLGLDTARPIDPRLPKAA